jgi:predicted permease
MGANSAIFSVLHPVVIAPLPYPDADRLVFVWERFPSMPDPPGGRIQVSRANLLEWKRQNTVFSDMAAFLERQLDETGSGEPRRTAVAFASANLFPALGIRTQTGRVFRPDEEEPGKDRVALLSDKHFEQRFGRDTKILGRPVTLGGATYTVIGVLEKKFHLPATWEGMDQRRPEVWVPLSRLWGKPEEDHRKQLLVPARLKPGVTLTRARDEMDAISKRLQTADPRNTGWTTNVQMFAAEDSSPQLRQALYLLFGAVVFLLLIGCANLANLTLARASLRSREITVRAALGATPWRIVRSLLGEALALSTAGAAAGLLLAHWCIKAVLALQPPGINRPELIQINGPVLAFTAAAAVLTALLFGLAPAISSARADLNSALKAAGGWGASASRLRTRQFLIAAEVALAAMLLAGAGLMIRSLMRVAQTGIGFDTSRLLSFDLGLP